MQTQKVFRYHLAAICLIVSCASRLDAQQPSSPIHLALLSSSSLDGNSSNIRDQVAAPAPAPAPASDPSVNLVLGLGVAGPSDAPDYSISSDTLASTHEGRATPQYMLGVAYQFGLNYYKKANGDANCDATSAAGATATEKLATVNSKFRCHPFGAFVSAKFNTSTDDPVNGVTFGLTHKLAQNFSVLLAGSLSPFQQPSAGFINAAVQTTIQQQAAGNPYYARFNTSAMLANKKDAFDGFSTNLMTAGGTAGSYTAGASIFTGTVLVTNYRFGFLFGVALTPNFKSLISAIAK